MPTQLGQGSGIKTISAGSALQGAGPGVMGAGVATPLDRQKLALEERQVTQQGQLARAGQAQQALQADKQFTLESLRLQHEKEWKDLALGIQQDQARAAKEMHDFNLKELTARAPQERLLLGEQIKQAAAGTAAAEAARLSSEAATERERLLTATADANMYGAYVMEMSTEAVQRGDAAKQAAHMDMLVRLNRHHVQRKTEMDALTSPIDAQAIKGVDLAALRSQAVKEVDAALAGGMSSLLIEWKTAAAELQKDSPMDAATKQQLQDAFVATKKEALVNKKMEELKSAVVMDKAQPVVLDKLAALQALDVKLGGKASFVTRLGDAAAETFSVLSPTEKDVLRNIFKGYGDEVLQQPGAVRETMEKGTSITSSAKKVLELGEQLSDGNKVRVLRALDAVSWSCAVKNPEAAALAAAARHWLTTGMGKLSESAETKAPLGTWAKTADILDNRGHAAFTLGAGLATVRNLNAGVPDRQTAVKVLNESRAMVLSLRQAVAKHGATSQQAESIRAQIRKKQELYETYNKAWETWRTKMSTAPVASTYDAVFAPSR